jgi:hypothetical protein
MHSPGPPPDAETHRRWFERVRVSPRRCTAGCQLRHALAELVLETAALPKLREADHRMVEADHRRADLVNMLSMAATRRRSSAGVRPIMLVSETWGREIFRGHGQTEEVPRMSWCSRSVRPSVGERQSDRACAADLGMNPETVRKRMRQAEAVSVARPELLLGTPAPWTRRRRATASCARARRPPGAPHNQPGTPGSFHVH